MALIGNQNSPDEHLDYKVLIRCQNEKILKLENEIKELKQQLKNCNLYNVSNNEVSVCPHKDRCAWFNKKECFESTAMKYRCFRAK